MSRTEDFDLTDREGRNYSSTLENTDQQFFEIQNGHGSSVSHEKTLPLFSYVAKRGKSKRNLRTKSRKCTNHTTPSQNNVPVLLMNDLGAQSKVVHDCIDNTCQQTNSVVSSENGPKWAVREISGHENFSSSQTAILMNEQQDILDKVPHRESEMTEVLSPGERLLRALYNFNARPRTVKRSKRKVKLTNGGCQDTRNRAETESCKILTNQNGFVNLSTNRTEKDIQLNSSAARNRVDIRNDVVASDYCPNALCVRVDPEGNGNSKEFDLKRSLEGGNACEDDCVVNNHCEEVRNSEMVEEISFSYYSDDDDESCVTDLPSTSLENKCLGNKESAEKRMLEKCLGEYYEDIRKQCGSIEKLFDEIDQNLLRVIKHLQLSVVVDGFSKARSEITSYVTTPDSSASLSLSNTLRSDDGESLTDTSGSATIIHYDPDAEMEMTAKLAAEYVFQSSSEDED